MYCCFFRNTGNTDCCHLNFAQHEIKLCYICKRPVEILNFYCYNCFNLLFKNYRITKYEFVDYMSKYTGWLLVGNLHNLNIVNIYLIYKMFFPNIPILNILLEKILYIKLHMALFDIKKK